MEESGAGFTEITALKPDEQADEMLLMGLRLREGIDLARLALLGGVTPSPVELADLEQLGLIEVMRMPSEPVAPSAKFGNWRANELNEIAQCVSPGVAPESSFGSPPPLWGRLGGGESRLAAFGIPPTPHPSPQGGGGIATHIRATPRGRFVLNAVVARLSKTFMPVSEDSDQAPLP